MDFKAKDTFFSYEVGQQNSPIYLLLLQPLSQQPVLKVSFPWFKLLRHDSSTEMTPLSDLT